MAGERRRAARSEMVVAISELTQCPRDSLAPRAPAAQAPSAGPARVGHDGAVRRFRLAALAAVAAFSASVAVVALASATANGLPAYTDGYQSWPKLNRKPVTGGSPAHGGTKNVYASKRKVGKAFPNGTVIVKSIARPGDRRARPSQVAVMRKVAGRWQFVEYQLSGARYSVLAQGQLCLSCHVRARADDYVFTKR